VKFGQYLIDSVNVLNLFLFAAAVAFFFHFIYPLLNAPPSVNVPPAREITAVTAVAAAEQEKQPPADYAVIEAQNLFHPTRVIPPEKTVAQQIPRPELVLHGTMITGGLKVAFVQDKKAVPTSPGRGVRQVALKEGESISGYRVQQVTEKMIVLVNGEDRMTIYLDELKERKNEITGTGAEPARAPAASSPQRTPAMQMPSRPARTPVALPPEPIPTAARSRSLPSAQSPPVAAAPVPPPPLMRRP
jgi:hypothetical protein